MIQSFHKYYNELLNKGTKLWAQGNACNKNERKYYIHTQKKIIYIYIYYESFTLNTLRETHNKTPLVHTKGKATQERRTTFHLFFFLYLCVCVVLCFLNIAFWIEYDNNFG